MWEQPVVITATMLNSKVAKPGRDGVFPRSVEKSRRDTGKNSRFSRLAVGNMKPAAPFS
jgi:hypothetical protein